ncbi:MAG TPA: phosphoglycolate phosphatase [Tabrizicola sp.]|nr:phosphoglycolate phosphatase [Tabrizicola sp.]
MADALHLVFDLDGTLIDSAPQIHAATNIVFANKGLPPFSETTVRGFIGNGVDVLVHRLMAHHSLPEDASLHADLVADFIRIYEEAFDLTTLYPSVSTALDMLSARGHRLAVCTNKPEGPTRAVLRHFGLLPLFPVIIGGDTLPQRKPNPEPLHAAIAALGRGKALFIGDSEVDAETAHAAKVPLALFSRGYHRAPIESLNAKLIFDDHAALPRLIAHLAPRICPRPQQIG